MWEYEDSGRRRALVRHASISGVVVSRLHWADELWPACRPAPTAVACSDADAEAVNSDTPVARTTAHGRVIEMPLRHSCH